MKTKSTSDVSRHMSHLHKPFLWMRAMQALVILLVSIGFVVPAFGAPYPAEGLLTQWMQLDGTQLTLRVFGDEFYARTTTEEGYTAIYSAEDRTYYYATIGKDGKSLISSGVAAHRPPPPTLVKHLKEPMETVTAIRQRHIQELDPDRGAKWKAKVKAVQRKRFHVENDPTETAEGAPEAAADPVSGSIVGLAILVQFPDDPATGQNDPVVFPAPREKIVRYFNDPGYADDGNTGSVRDYFYDQSNGLLTHTQQVTSIITAPHPRNYYNYSDYPVNQTFRSSGESGRLLLADAVTILMNGGFDFSSLSLNSTDHVISTSILFAGFTSGVWAKGLWPHKSAIPPINVGTPSSPRFIYGYQITNVPNAAPVIGTVCHELAHLVLSYPDLYDYGYESTGIGGHCLMGSGNLHNGERTPAPINLYLKDYSGWSTITDLTPTQLLEATIPATDNIGYRIRMPDSLTEYFLIENRGGGDPWAEYCPDHGIAIWHIDENVDGNGNQQMTQALHYEVSLEQADGMFDMENGRNWGDSNDLFDVSDGHFNNATLPNAHWWNDQPSDITIAVTSPPGSSMTVSFGANYLKLNPLGIDVVWREHVQDVMISSNGTWTWETDASWIWISEPISQTGNQYFQYTLPANLGSSSRLGTITFTCDGVSATHTVSQDAMPADIANQLLVQTLPDGTQSIWEVGWCQTTLVTPLTLFRESHATAGQLDLELPPYIGTAVATSFWGNHAVTPESGRFLVSFTTTPGGSAVDTVFGFCDGPADFWNDLAVSVRFNTGGTVDARAGSTYAAATTFAYTAGASYLVEMEIDVETKRYSATVTPAGGIPVLIANNFAFRTEQSGVTQLDHFAYLCSTGGTQTLSDFVVSDLGTVTATTAWGNHPTIPQSGSFTARFTTTPGGSGLDTVLGFSNGPADFWDDLAVALRFNTSGIVDARNGSGYTAATALSYNAGVSYHVEMNIDVDAKRYSATVTPDGGSPILIADNFAFRTEQSNVPLLDHLAYLCSTGGTQTASDLIIPGENIRLPWLRAATAGGPLIAETTTADTEIIKEVRLVPGIHATDETITVINRAGGIRHVSFRVTDDYFAELYPPEVHMTSSGDTVVGPEDNWFIYRDVDDLGWQSSNPTLMISWRFSRNLPDPEFVSVPSQSSDRLEFQFETIMTAGEFLTISIRRQVFESPSQALAEGVPLESNNPKLISLVLSAGMLSPAFDAETTGYGAFVERTIPSITVTPTVAHSGATVTVNSTPVLSGMPSSPVALNAGTNLLTVDVTAQDGVTTQAYAIDVNREAGPEIAVEQAGGSWLENGAHQSFGMMILGECSKSEFIIRNIGSVDLINLSLVKQGPDAAEFTILTPPIPSTMEPGGSADAVIRLAPVSEGTKTAELLIYSNDGNENPFMITITGSGASAREVFDVAASNSGLTGADAAPIASPFGDGVENLLKFAFNMNMDRADSHLMIPSAGISGQPSITTIVHGSNRILRVEYLRRKGHGLLYLPRVSTTLETGSFFPMTGTPVVTPIDDNWDRVVIEESMDAVSVPRIFASLEVGIE